MLLTGFEGYGGRGLNPAAEVVRALDGETIGGETVTGRILPVDYERLATRIRELIAETAPRAVIALGLWPGEPMIRLERIAVNLNDFEIPDNRGALHGGAIAEGVPLALRSTLPVEAIRSRLLDAGIPARLSSSAGNFLCNALMFRALEAVAQQRPETETPCGFIHLPYLPEQVAELLRQLREARDLELHQRADLASMALPTQIAAVRLAIEATLRDGA